MSNDRCQCIDIPFLKYYFNFRVLNACSTFPFFDQNRIWRGAPTPGPSGVRKETLQMSIEIDSLNGGETAVIYANEYLNKITGEQIERECRRKIDEGCKRLLVSFRETEIVNSIGI